MSFVKIRSLSIVLLLAGCFSPLTASPIHPKFELKKLMKLSNRIPDPSNVLWKAYWKTFWGDENIDLDEIKDSINTKQFIKKYEQFFIYLDNVKVNMFIATKYTNDLQDLVEEIDKSKRINFVVKKQVKESMDTILTYSQTKLARH